VDDIEFAQLRHRLLAKLAEAVQVNEELVILERQVQAEEERRSAGDTNVREFRPRPSGTAPEDE
jgi:hypothetical protein